MRKLLSVPTDMLIVSFYVNFKARVKLDCISHTVYAEDDYKLLKPLKIDIKFFYAPSWFFNVTFVKLKPTNFKYFGNWSIENVKIALLLLKFQWFFTKTFSQISPSAAIILREWTTLIMKNGFKSQKTFFWDKSITFLPD